MQEISNFSESFFKQENTDEKESSTHEEWLLREYSKLMHREAQIIQRDNSVNRNKSDLEDKNVKK